MGMFDYYEPAVDLNCSGCGARLDGWQGKDGPNELLLWKQGKAGPGRVRDVDNNEVVEFGADGQDDERKLPDAFELHTICDNCDSYVKATGKCSNGVWTSTTIVEI